MHWKNKIFILVILAILVLSFSHIIFAEDTYLKPRTVRYKITKHFSLQVLADLWTLQFKYPLIRKDLTNQRITELYTEPKYNALVDDPNGNEIAIFYFSSLKGGQPVNITISYKIEIDVPDINIDFSRVPNSYADSVLGIDIRDYLKSEEGINLNDELIQRTAKSIVGEIGNPYLKGKAIYDFIVENIDYENVEDVSGVQYPRETLTIKRGNCADITKLFIVLARACGIAARQVDGVVFEPNVSRRKSIQKNGHAWAEIYLPKYGWFPVDPTFGISKKNEYYCFPYNTHLREFYGQIISRDIGSLYRGSSIEVRTYSQMNYLPVRGEAQIEIELD